MTRVDGYFILCIIMDPMQQHLVIIALMHHRRARARERAPRRMWVHPILQGRSERGEYHRLVRELRLDEVRFVQYFRLSRAQFQEVLYKVGPRIAKMDTNYRKAIGPSERLAICLR